MGTGISQRTGDMGYAREKMAVQIEHAQKPLKRGIVREGWGKKGCVALGCDGMDSCGTDMMARTVNLRNGKS
jgi:hypothetical protein